MNLSAVLATTKPSLPKKPNDQMVNDQMVHYIDVILPLAIRDCYTYSIPDGLSMPAPGTRVLVPLMRKQVRGIVLREHTEEVSSDFAAKIKPIFSVSETAPAVSAEQLALWQWMSSYYMCTLGEVMAAALPSGLDNRLLNPPKRRRTHIAPYDGPVEPMHPLTPAQAKSVDEIGQLWSSGKQIVLLHGVTSSGKTDMYIHLIRAQLEAGKNVLYLVPEIALTTQLTSRLQHIFGDRLTVYHSRFTDAEREELYLASARQEPHVVIGARSAVFLPIPNIGLVIVDEEHEPSYKQAEPAPRYHARAAAILLGQIHKAKVLLGTATPSVESYYLAQKGVYGLVTLTERYGGVELPEIRLVDLKRQYERKEMYGHFSDPLVARIRETLAEHKQVILFQNRRGYAPQLQCVSCGQPPRCVQCDVPMTLHLRAKELRCHYCGYHAPIPPVCPQCGGELKSVGFGTERIEDEIQALFPEARVLRMDLDSTRSKTAYQDIINAFSRHECDILVGTQMVTKGLHFDDVRLVAVLNADPLFNQPDFRAYERAFQMLEQVAGRAGRKGTKGEVWIQTFDTKNAVLEMVRNHDYEALYRQQTAEREMFHYPPFHRIIRIQMRDHNAARVQAVAMQLQAHLKQVFGARISSVIIPPVERVQAYTIRELNLRIEQGANIGEAKRRLKESIDYILSNSSNKNVKLIIDCDPI